MLAEAGSDLRSCGWEGDWEHTPPHAYLHQLRPSGYVLDSLQCALWAFFSGHNPEEVIVAAVNLGGDADTIGAIAGGLAGVYWGYAALPSRWHQSFSPAQRERLDQAVAQVLAARGKTGWCKRKFAASGSGEVENGTQTQPVEA